MNKACRFTWTIPSQIGAKGLHSNAVWVIRDPLAPPDGITEESWIFRGLTPNSLLISENQQRAIMSEYALIVVDMVNDFVDDKGALYCGQSARDIIPFIKGLIEDCRKSGGLVIYLQDTHEEDDKEFERFPEHSIAGTWGHKIIPELAPQQGDIVIQKQRFSAFFETELGDLLRKHHIRDVEVVGVCTHICVMDTVGDLANRDYNIAVPRAGVADFDPEFHEFALKRMDRIYGANVR